MKPTFNHIEDYIEFIGGYRDANGKKFGLFDTVPSPLSLARYDVSIIDSLASQTAEIGNPYTDKQSALAVRLVDKYRRQLAGLNPSVTVPDDLEKPSFRLGIRHVDRTKSVTIQDGKFVVKFPYDTKLIDLIKKQVREGHGHASFDNDAKVWRLAMTEHMLNWIMAVCTSNDFIISDEVQDLYTMLVEAEKTNYTIELDLVDDQLVISNASQSLLDYINDKLGGLSIDNLLTLVDNSEVLSYTVSPVLKEVIKSQYPDYYKLIFKRKRTIKKDPDFSMDQIVNYARLVNRLPLYVYDNGLPKENTEEIIYLNRGLGYDLVPKILVTHTNLMIGSRKESWMSNSEKIVILE